MAHGRAGGYGSFEQHFLGAFAAGFGRAFRITGALFGKLERHLDTAYFGHRFRSPEL